MHKEQSSDKKVWDLESRTTELAKRVIRLCKRLPRNPINDRIISQLVGSSGSIGANYREGNDALGKRDFLLRMRTSRKESKEALHWLECLQEANNELPFNEEFKYLLGETREIKLILSAIIKKTLDKRD